jgi:hypothetical protein
MSNRALSDYLIELVKGLSSGEKKHFRVYATRTVTDQKLMFLDLFDLIDKTKDVDDESIRKKFKNLKIKQLSDLKSYLYEQLLVSLRLLNRRNIELKIREQIDRSSILFSKGHVRQSLSSLRKIKSFASQMHKDALLLEICELEKQIEYKLPNISGIDLIEETTAIRNSLMNEGAWFDLAIKVLSLFKQIGQVKNEEQALEIRDFFEDLKSKINAEATSFYGKIYMLQAHMWYYYMLQENEKSFFYASQWVDMFDRESVFKKIETEYYLSGLNAVMATFHSRGDYRGYLKTYNLLNKFVSENQHAFDENLNRIAFRFVEYGRLKLFLSMGQFDDGIKYLEGFMEKFKHQLKKHENDEIDNNIFIVFNFEIAKFYFGVGDFKNAIKHLNEIINLPKGPVRQDFQAFSRILLLLSHFELGNTELLEYQLKSVLDFLKGVNENQEMQVLILKFIKKNLHSNEEKLKEEFVTLNSELIKLTTNPFEKRCLPYFDFIDWTESKIKGLPMQQIVREKFLSQSKD